MTLKERKDQLAFLLFSSRMDTKVENKTFDVNDSLFPFIVDHTLHGFNFARSCQDLSLGTNFYYGKNQEAYVTPNQNKSKEEIFDHCLWHQPVNPLVCS